MAGVPGLTNCHNIMLFPPLLPSFLHETTFFFPLAFAWSLGSGFFDFCWFVCCVLLLFVGVTCIVVCEKAVFPASTCSHEAVREGGQDRRQPEGGNVSSSERCFFTLKHL